MHRPISRLTAFLLLCLYGWSCTPLSSFAFAALAEISGEHEVRIQWADSGVRVVLSHQPATTPTVAVSDHHRPLTRALSSLCSLSGQGDHIFARSSELYIEARDISVVRFAQVAKAFTLEPWPGALLGFRVVNVMSPEARRLIHGKVDRNAEPRASLGTIALLV